LRSCSPSCLVEPQCHDQPGSSEGQKGGEASNGASPTRHNIGSRGEDAARRWAVLGSTWGQAKEGAMAVNAGVQTLQRRRITVSPLGMAVLSVLLGQARGGGGLRGRSDSIRAGNEATPVMGGGRKALGGLSGSQPIGFAEHILLLLCGPCGPGLWAWPVLRSTRVTVPSLELATHAAPRWQRRRWPEQEKGARQGAPPAPWTRR
jgi:hypothetical protein